MTKYIKNLPILFVMRVIADLHIHSKYSRATSTRLDIENLEKYARIKGLDLMGTGDFTHPKWLSELKKGLREDGTGILKTENNFPFLLSGEISLIYTQGGKGRKVHNILLAPSFEIVEQVNEALLKRGRTDYDGRPIFGMSCIDFAEMIKEISKDIEIIPAHCWTPWFGLFGSMSGFDSVEECFKDQTKHIFALETGLSSDPLMNWRLSSLDKYSLVSFSDLHSFWPWRIGREATIFEIELTYKNIINALREKKIAGTIEVDPNYGKYHMDGHRNCRVSMSPQEAIKNKNICPVCRRPLTIGVLHRVEELADREEGFRPKNAPGFYSLIPLSEIISNLLNTGIASQKAWKEYNNLIANFGSELNILMNPGLMELKKFTDEKIAEKIIENREGKIKIHPGYDGEYGYPVFDEGKRKAEKEIKPRRQRGLSEFIS